MSEELDVTALRRRARKYIKSGSFHKLKEDLKEDVVTAVLIESAIATNPEANGADRARFVKLASELVSQLEGGTDHTPLSEGIIE